MDTPSFPIIHDFSIDRLSPQAKPNHQPYVKMTFFFKKRADISYNNFHRHWETVHADLAVASKPFAIYIKRYTQYHLTPEYKGIAETAVPGMQLMDYDGCSEIMVESIEKGLEFFKSAEYVEKMNLDEGNWLARPVGIMMGYDNLIFGEALSLPGTTDGILSAGLRSMSPKNTDGHS